MEGILESASRTAGTVASVRALARGASVDLGRLQQNCVLHGPYFSLGVRGGAAGRSEAWSGCSTCIEQHAVLVRRRAEEAERRRWEEQLSLRIDASGVPLRFRGKRLTDYRATHKGQVEALRIGTEYVETFEQLRRQGASLVFAGKPGTGKSLLAMAILQELCRRGYEASYTTCQSLILRIRATWGRDGDGREADVVSEFSTVPFLVIDEIGVQAGTENEKALLFEIIDARYGEMLPTIYATNLDSKEFRAFVGDRVWDRLTECARWVPFAWGSYRATAKEELKQRLEAAQPPQRAAASGRQTAPRRAAGDWTDNAI